MLAGPCSSTSTLGFGFFPVCCAYVVTVPEEEKSRQPHMREQRLVWLLVFLGK